MPRSLILELQWLLSMGTCCALGEPMTPSLGDKNGNAVLAVGSSLLVIRIWPQTVGVAQSYYRTNQLHKSTDVLAGLGRGEEEIRSAPVAQGIRLIDDEVKPDTGTWGDADEEDHLDT